MNLNQSKPAKFRCFISFLLIVFIIVVNSSCKIKSEAQNETSSESLPEEKNIVETVVLEKQDFTQEIISNGKLAAIEKAGLYFQNAGTIDAVNVRNGQTVQIGTELARLQFELYMAQHILNEQFMYWEECKYIS